MSIRINIINFSSTKKESENLVVKRHVIENSAENLQVAKSIIRTIFEIGWLVVDWDQHGTGVKIVVVSCEFSVIVFVMTRKIQKDLHG